MKNKSGFTIIEILVVIGIIAILTVVIFPSLNNIKAKNRDAEKVADIAAIQLGLSLYKNATSTNQYPKTLDELLGGKYITLDSKTSPDANSYEYVPLAKSSSGKCTFYHLGVTLELPSAQVDEADNFNSTVPSTGAEIRSGNYYHCVGYSGSGLATGTEQYNVHP